MDKSKVIEIIKRVLFLLLICVMIGIVIFIMKKYEVEGEKSLPYSIEKILIISTVDGTVNEDQENIWNMNLSEVNDVFIYMKGNEDTIKNDKITIKDITLDNMVVNKFPLKGELKLYRPTGDLNTLYTYSEQNYLTTGLTYTGAKIDDLKNLEISNIGGVLAFRTAVENLGNYTSNDDTEVVYNGSLLPKIDVILDDIKFNISFDMTIKTSENVMFRGNINLDFPSGDIITEGKSNIEITDFSNVVFKRVKNN